MIVLSILTCISSQASTQVWPSELFTLCAGHSFPACSQWCFVCACEKQECPAYCSSPWREFRQWWRGGSRSHSHSLATDYENSRHSSHRLRGEGGVPVGLSHFVLSVVLLGLTCLLECLIFPDSLPWYSPCCFWKTFFYTNLCLRLCLRGNSI